MIETLRSLERELLLLARHQAGPSAARRVDCRTLDRSAYLLLSRLDAEGPMSIGQLAEAFALDVSTVNRQTAAALHAGLLARIPDPEGGIARKLTITDKGARRLDAERERVVDALVQLVGDWSPEDLRQLSELLERLNIRIEVRDGQRPWPRSAPVPGR